MQVWLPWVVSIAGIGGVCFLVLLAVASFLHKSEKSWLATIVTVVGLTVALCCIVLIPADIYNASHSPCEKVVGRGEVIKIIYYVLYSILLVFAFIFAPFTFFYCDGLLDEDTTWKKRVFHGLKFTIVLVIVVAVILVLGFVLTAFNLGAPPKDPDENWEQYISSIYQNASNLEGAISFGLFMLVIVGFIVWLTYTSLGLSAWGIFLIKGTKRVDTEIRETQEEMEKTKKKKKALDEKYESSGKKKSTKDADNKAQLEDIEEFLSQKLSTLQKLEGGWTRILSIFTPLKVVIGFAFLAFAAFIMSGVVMTLVDRIINSKCHFSCGFVLTSKGTLPNPVDLLLTYSSIYFPLDCIVFVMIVTFIVLCTVYAIYRVGIRFLWIKLYTVAPFRTLPQALVMASILIMLAILVLNFQLLSIAPQYTTFGSRTYASEASNKTVLCDMNAPVDEECPVCPMTELSYIVNRLSIQLPYVSLLLFFGTWAWVGTFIAYGLVIIFWKRASNTMTQEQIIDDADFDI